MVNLSHNDVGYGI